MTTTAELVSALRESHDRLAGIVASLPPEGVERSAYPADWSIADTLSHLGSGAEITLLILNRATQGQPEPEQHDYVEIWDRWNAKSPPVQAADSVVADAALLGKLESIDLDSVSTLRAYGTTMTGAEFLSMRLDEHVLHTWDVDVAIDSSARLPAERLPFLLDRLGTAAPRTAGEDAAREPRTLRIAVTEPDHGFRISVGETVSLGGDADYPEPNLTLPAEAFVRLVYGRLPRAENVTIGGTGIADAGPAEVLEQLRGVFHGY